LFIALATIRSDAGRYQERIRPEAGAEEGEFKGGTDKTLGTCFKANLREVANLCFCGGGNIEAAELGAAHGCEDGNSKEIELGGMVEAGLVGPFNHLGPTKGVEGKELNGELCDALNCLGDGIGDIMKLEVKKDAVTQFVNFSNNVRPTGCK
jgi:hypothetical protein